MGFAARWQDGLVADTRAVRCEIDAATLVIRDAETGAELDRWPAPESFALPARQLELRLGNGARPAGARLAVTGIADLRTAVAALPGLARARRREGRRELRRIALATAALASVIALYLFGVPLLAERLAQLVPPAWEAKIGTTAAGQIEAALTGGTGFVLCDADRDSPGNRAISGYVERVFSGLDSPFKPVVSVVRSDIANAFALPGGRVYLFSALLQASRTPDEFAGVLTHELGHVYYRHGLQSVIAGSTTGLLVGFVLGDMTGLSVAGAIGAALIDNRFSRQDEAAADGFAGLTARRLGYQPKALVDLLERVAGDDAFSRALALFSNHPLTASRRAALETMAGPVPGAVPAFTPAEWSAIRDLCPPPPPPPLPRAITKPPHWVPFF